MQMACYGRLDFYNKHTVVTGAASGIGLELSKRLLARRPASISMLDIASEEVKAAAEELDSIGTSTEIQAMEVDVRNEKAV